MDNTLLFAVSLSVVGLGAAMWRFRWIHLLSNIDARAVDETKKKALARYAGVYIMLIGGLLLLLTYLIGQTQSERATLALVAGVLVVVALLTVGYLAGLQRFIEK